MKIYIDVLVIINAVITLIYIRCICRVTHEKPGLKREIQGAAAGGIGSLIAAVQSRNFFSALIISSAKFAMIIIIIVLTFRPKSFIGCAKRFFLYLMCELLMGGLCFLIVNITKSPVICIKNYTVYFDVSLLQISICCAAVYLSVSIYETIQRRKSGSVKRYKVSYRLGNYEITLPAIADTGNKLCDSFTGAPVVILRSDELYRRFIPDSPEHLGFYGFRPTPFETISGSGIIYVTSKGDVKIIGKKNERKINCCIGIIPGGGRSGYAIFNPEILF